MNNPNPPSSFKQKSLESFRSQISGVTVASGLRVHRWKKRDRKWSESDECIAETSICSLKPKLGKKPEPSSPKIARRCTECGKQFWSWKALFGHMRCHPERQWRGINPPSNLRQPVLPENPAPCFEGKFTEEDHEVATCLVILANGLTKMSTPSAMIHTGLPKFGDSPKESSVIGDIDSGASLLDSSGRFKCACCKRIFGSHQALGGHRASHKNVKGCFVAARRNDGEDDYHNGDCRSDEGGEGVVKETEEKKMAMVLGHKCSICLRVFSSGQALGGHMRCHWEKGDEPPPPQGMNLDLNLPASIDNDGDSSSSIISPSDLAWDLRLGI